MKVRSRILLLASLLLLVSVGGIGNLMWQLPHIEQMQDLENVLQVLMLLGLFGVGLIFSVLELVRHEIMNPIFQLAAQVARLKEREIDGHRLEFTGSKDIDLLTRALNDLLDGFQKKDDFYHILVETSPDMIFLLDREGRVLFGNLNAARQWNYKAEEIIGKRQEELFPPDIVERHKQVIQKVFNSGQPVCLDVHETIGQHKCWIDARIVPVLNEDGHVTAVLGISRDITERKKAEEALRESEEIFSQFMTHSPIYVFFKDENIKAIRLSENYTKMLERPISELLGKNMNDLFPSDLAKSMVADDKRVLKECKKIEVEEELNGRVYSTIKFPLYREGKPTCLAGFTVDITERKRAEERLERVNHCLLGLGPDFNANVGCITALSGELLNGTCALYNRLEDGMLRAVGQWHTPPDFQPKDTPDGHICYDVIRGPGELLFIPDLHKTRYAETDPNVRRYRFQSYLGQPVHCGSVIVGSLCVAFQQTFMPTENDKHLLSILASALSVEENRHLAEQKLREIQKKFQDLIETVNDFVWEIDALGHYTYASQSVKKILGYEPEKIIGKRPFDLMPAEESQRIAEIFRSLAAEQQPIIALENINVHKDGYEVVLETNGIPFFDAEGKLKGYRGVDRDISRRKHAELALQASEQNYRTLFNENINGIIAADIEAKKIIYVNKSICRMLGYSQEELLQLGIKDIHPEYALARIEADFQAQTRGELMLVTIPCVRKDGSVFYADVSAGAMVLSGRRCNVAFFVDITTRLDSERNASMLANAIENAHHGCLIISEDYKVVFSNDYALVKLGFESDELKNFDLFSLCADQEQVKDIIETMKVTKRWMGEIAIIKKDGGQFPALVSVTALDADDDASGKGGDVILFQDITIQKEMREKLLTSEKLAVMGRLTADVAHELNNPLAIVIGGTQLMLSRIDEKPSPFKSQLETVLRNARRCKTILNNLLGYGRTIGKKEEAVNLPNLIREAIDDVNYQHDMSAIETVLNYNLPANAEITGNRSALLSVFINLIRNARQAMGEKGRLTITIEKEDRKHLRIELHDTGSGISKEQKAKLFKPFTSGWKEGESSGLGLATSLGIIETHGGSMSAESAGVGKGATFTILLPCEFKGEK